MASSSYEEIDSNDVVHFANNVIVENEESDNGSYEVDGPDNGSYEVDGPENSQIHFANNVIVKNEESDNGSYEIDGPDNGSYEVDGPENSQIHFWEYEDTTSTCSGKNVLSDHGAYFPDEFVPLEFVKLMMQLVHCGTNCYQNFTLMVEIELKPSSQWAKCGPENVFTASPSNQRKRITEKMNSKKEGGSASNQMSVEDRYSQWKSHIPVLYDWFVNHNLLWPTQSCRWGSLLEEQTYKNRHRLYISEQTDGTVPNTLVIATVEVVKPRVAAAEHIAQFNEEARSPFVKKHKTILHPGEVNRIRELPSNTNIVATHTDSPNVMIWSVESQPNRTAVMGAPTSTPDLVLTGHKDNAEFALAMCSTEPFVLSGGRDKYVVLWSIQDHIATLAAAVDPDDKQSTNLGGSSEKAANSPSVGPRGIYRGHKDTVEDVQFCPSSAHEFCSVGDDSCLILWDARVGYTPAVKVEKAHDGDLHCVDWNTHDINFILTGSADNTVHMFDRRKLNSRGVGSPVYKFEGHDAPVLCVQWCPNKSSVFGSGAEDGIINIWDHDKVGKMPGSADPTVPATSPGLFFRHAGHRDKVVDFHWNAFDPWTIVSVSDDCASTGGGGTLQIWRMLDLIYRPEDEVLAELDKYKSYILGSDSDT
ncbi:WD-40 repeat-containing protein MSI4 [Trifolium repens]|nr:WD-40 repeat-containing protein MSI4 [Trifolium repens]